MLYFHYSYTSSVLYSIVVVALTYLAALIIGVMIKKWGMYQANKAQKEVLLKYQEERLRLLHSAHDSIAGKIAGALLLCELHNDESLQKDVADWGAIGFLLRQAQDELRENIIDPIKVDSNIIQGNATNLGVTEFQFHNIVSQLESLLTILGFTGSIIINGSIDFVDRSKLSVCIDILREIHTNIIKHGIRGKYITTVSFSENSSIHINSSNRSKESKRIYIKNTGLMLICQIVQQYNGAINYCNEDNEWNIAIVL